MAGAPLHRGRSAALAAVIVALTTTPVTAAATGGNHRLTLPKPVTEVDPLATPQLQLRPDRLLKSQVPGTVDDREDVRVELGPTGAPTVVTDTQHLVIQGAGNYIIRELGPAREAVGLSDTVPPVLELGTVVWQGFSPGRRELSARLTLDPGIEAARLPLKVGFAFTDRAGKTQPLGAGARAPSAGTVTVTLTNNTASNRIVQSGTAAAGPLAHALDVLRRAGEEPRVATPPTGGNGLPASLPGTTTGSLSETVIAPLRITGTITAPEGSSAVHGPGTTPMAGGAAIAGTLSSAVSFTVQVGSGDRIGLNLDVRPWVDPRTVTPPAPAKTWSQWARSNPSASAIADATQTLMLTAAAAARSAEYSPYLQADAPGPDLSTFTYVVAAPPRLRQAAANVQPRPGAIAAAAVALLAIIGNAALLRRRL